LSIVEEEFWAAAMPVEAIQAAERMLIVSDFFM
jgi:hypothetical protein